jgi:acetylornithine/succinyldiaminopimelate/putrescine aminotransferase
MNARALFQQHLAQTSTAPIGIHITRAEGCKLWDAEGKEYLDLIGGISVCNIGHRHPNVVAAIKAQADAYLHVMVYGEVVQSPQVLYAQKLASLLDPSLNSVYFTNSGAEAVEGAIKLARRVTGRPGIIGAKYSYHGSTTGALALMGDEYWKAPFRPLMPGVRQYEYGSQGMIDAVDEQTACVIVEPVQAEAGVLVPDPGWLRDLKQRCREMGALLVFDEIQTGFGRTGRLWAYEQSGVVPDVLLLGKALGGGMPLGAFISSRERMLELADAPVLGHITTFGGHPVCCAAGLAGLEALVEERMVEGVKRKETLFVSLLKGNRIEAVRSCGLLIAVVMSGAEEVQRVLKHALNQGVFSDWFLFAPHCVRIAPPLTITDEEIRRACEVLTSVSS